MNPTDIVASKVELKDNDAFIRKIAQRAGEYSAHPAVLTVADDLFGKGGVRSMFDFAKNKIEYAKDSSFGENLRMPDYIVDKYMHGNTPVGDCDDKTLFLASMLINKGYPVRIVGAHYLKGEGKPSDINHVYLEYQNYFDKYNTDRWIPLDPTGMPYGKKSPEVIPIVYYKVSTPQRLSVSAFTKEDINSVALRRISNYHSQLFSRVGLFNAKDLETIKFFAESYGDDELLNEFVERATPLINTYGVLRIQDLKKFNPAVIHEALWIKNGVGGSLIKNYNDLTYPNTQVEFIPLPVIAGVVVGVIVGVAVYMTTHDWKKALLAGVVGGVIGGVATWAVMSVPAVGSLVGGATGLSSADFAGAKSQSQRKSDVSARTSVFQSGIDDKYNDCVAQCNLNGTYQWVIDDNNYATLSTKEECGKMRNDVLGISSEAKSIKLSNLRGLDNPVTGGNLINSGTNDKSPRHLSLLGKIFAVEQAIESHLHPTIKDDNSGNSGNGNNNQNTSGGIDMKKVALIGGGLLIGGAIMKKVLL